jgi:hypothetical protein
LLVSNRKRLRRPTPRQVAKRGLAADQADELRQMLAAMGAPSHVLDMAEAGVSLDDLLAAARHSPPLPDAPELVAQSGAALDPASKGKGDPFLAEMAVVDLLGLLRSAHPAKAIVDDGREMVDKVGALIEAAERSPTLQGCPETATCDPAP